MTTSYNTIDIDGYLVPVMEPYMFSDFLGIFDSAKCCILKCFEGTNAITLSILSTYKGNGIEELYLDYPGVGVIKYYRSTTEIENIHTILIKYADKPQQIGVSGTSGSLTDEQYLELQTTNAQIKLADDDNMLLSKCIDNGTTFSYSGMQVNSSSQVIGYTIVVSADKS